MTERGHASAILGYWRSAEIFTPRPVPARPTPGEVFTWIPTSLDAALPWASSTKHRRHTLYIGLIDMPAATAGIIATIGAPSDHEDDTDLHATVGGRTAAFAVTLDERGVPIPETATLSAFGWAAVQCATAQGLGPWLDRYSDAMAHAADRINAWIADRPMVEVPAAAASPAASAHPRTRRLPAPLATTEIGQLYSLVLSLTRGANAAPLSDDQSPCAGWDAECVALVHSQESADDADALNSFLVEDLEKCRVAADNNALSPVLSSYLAKDPPATRYDLNEQPAVLARLLRPANWPLARWPNGRTTLSLMQQAAVNLATGLGRPNARNANAAPMPSLASSDGPPGTGKTTMLRDCIAAIITQRAAILAGYADPDLAYRSEVSIQAGRTTRRYHPLKPDLADHLIVVASTNNGAVDNITRELPAVRTIQPVPGMPTTMDYFGAVASQLIDGPTDGRGRTAWGLISAPLGNMSNRRRVASTVWSNAGASDITLPRVIEGYIDKNGAAVPPSHDARPWEEVRIAYLQHYTLVRNTMARLEGSAAERARADAHWSKPRAEREMTRPWTKPQIEDARALLFSLAMDVHKSFLVHTWPRVRSGLDAAFAMIRGTRMPAHVQPDLWALAALVIPVVSTTFASFGRLFRTMERQSIPWLFVDEAGQGTPQSAAGAMLRARRAYAVGDPLQVEPVVTTPDPLLAALRRHYAVPSDWDIGTASVQTVANRATAFGAHRGPEDARLWVGCPLVVHRRCRDPHFSIANRIAYGNGMVYATPDRPSALAASLGESRWFHIAGRPEGSGHWIPDEGNAVLQLIEDVVGSQPDDLPDLAIISPYRSCAAQMRRLVLNVAAGWPHLPQGLVSEWIRTHIGTVHVCQGKEYDAVAIMLGGNPSRPAAMEWAGGRPNLLNVAVTRAQSALYVVGNLNVWRGAGVFADLATALPVDTRFSATTDLTARRRA